MRCARLPETLHGKQGVCPGLPPVAGGPLPVKEGVDAYRLVSARLFLRAVRAWALVAAAAGACLADHGEMILTDSSRCPSAGVLEARLHRGRGRRGSLTPTSGGGSSR